MSFELFLGWVIFSFVVGAIGQSRKIGFGGAFLASLLLSPLIGLIITLVSKNKSEEKYQEEILKVQKNQQDALIKMAESKSSVNSRTSIIQELEKLKKLKDDEVINEEEFLKLKHQILDSEGTKTESFEKSSPQNYVRLENLEHEQLLQFIDEKDSSKNPEVKINDAIPKNGFYKLNNKYVAFEIINGKIVNEYFTKYYKQKNGSIIEIGLTTRGYFGICRGNPVWLENNPAPDGKYSTAFFETIDVSNGIIKSFGVSFINIPSKK